MTLVEACGALFPMEACGALFPFSAISIGGKNKKVETLFFKKQKTALIKNSVELDQKFKRRKTAGVGADRGGWGRRGSSHSLLRRGS